VAPHGDEIDSLREHPVREIARHDGGFIVRLAGELDVYNAAVVREALAQAAEQEPERVVVDLAEVGFVDSTMLGILVEARSVLANRRALLLAAPGLQVRRALEVSGLDRHLEVHESVEAALAASIA